MNKEIYNIYKYIPKEDVLPKPPFKNIQVEKFVLKKHIRLKLIYNALVTFFQHIVFFISDGKGLVHYSFVINKCPKFCFLNYNDYVISPCWTRKDKRGMGIYAAMIDYIGAYYKNKDVESNVYILVRNENKSSVKGIEKSHFTKIGIVKKSRFLKIYSKIIEK